jgi:hypothetical protein
MKLNATLLHTAQVLVLFCLSIFCLPLSSNAQFNDYKAFMEVGTSCNINNDTYDDFAFSITNYSTNPTFNIVQIKINLATGVMKDIFFDPFGSAGDQVTKGLTVNSGGTATGYTASSYGSFDGNTGGYREVLVNFASSGGNTFGQFNSFSFSLDIDHSSLKNYSGSENAGRISGLDLVGSTVSIEFSDGTILSSQLTPIKDCDGKSEVILSDKCSVTGLPTLVPTTVPFNPTYTYDTTHQMRLLGLPNKEVILYQVEGALDLKTEKHIPSPFDIDEHEENTFIDLKVDTFSLGALGLIDVPVKLDNTAANGGRNHFFAITIGDSSGITQGGQYRFCKSPVSNAPVLHYYEGLCVNCLGGEITASNGDVFQVDHYEAGGGYPNEDYTLYQGIANTQDDDIFKSQLSGQLNYDIPVPNGDYEVYCLFSENEYGVPFAPASKSSGGAGSRKFNVLVEGTTVDNSLDIFSVAGGHSTALYRRYVATVTDLKLDLNLQDLFQVGIDGPCMSGFCVKPLVLSVFPVEFSAFNAVQEGRQVNLTWTTISELNNDRFEIERSTDGGNYIVLGSVKGKGTTDVLNTYHSQDLKPQVGLNYYRIRQVDVDGGISYSETVAIHVQPYSKMTVFPNPSSDKFVQLQLDGFEPKQDLLIRVFNPMGQLLHQESGVIGRSGKLATRLDLRHLAQGMYTIFVTSDTGMGNSAVIILR